MHAVIRRALRDAVRWGRSPATRPHGRPAEPARAAARQAWTAGELRRFLEHVAGDRLFALWRLAATTGMRRGELAGLTWRALDLDGARLSVEQQLVPTARRRDVRPAEVGAVRRTRRARPGDGRRAARAPRAQVLERDFAGDAYDDHDLVFADELGGPIHPQRLTRVVHRAPQGRRHPDRDAAHPAPHRGDAGADVRRAGAHRRRPARRRPEQILATYAHLLPQSDELAAERVAAALTVR